MVGQSRTKTAGRRIAPRCIGRRIGAHQRAFVSGTYEALKTHRDDLIMMSVTGDRHGRPQVDYTVNPAVGFPMATGPRGAVDPVGYALPAWDCMTGQQAALGILAAERHRRLTGRGQVVELALKDMALAMPGNLGIIGEVTVNGVDRPGLAIGSTAPTRRTLSARTERA